MAGGRHLGYGTGFQGLDRMTLVHQLENMPDLSHTNVVCCIYDAEAARRVRIAVQREGATPLPLCWQQVIQEATPVSDWSALVYDLEPRDERTSEVIAAFSHKDASGTDPALSAGGSRHRAPSGSGDPFGKA